MSSGGAGPLVPTFHGFVHNSMDGLILFEACLSGKLHHVPRRPHDRERSSLIKSGSIFIYEENASGIKRWTDGVAWSPSRILGNFLIYRELEKPFPPGEKKRAMKRKRASMPGEPYPRRDSDDNEGPEQITPVSPPTPSVNADVKSPDGLGGGNDQDKELERSLIGSLVDSYGFRPDGLVKKTMSISLNGISHHMVSYYKVDDVKNNVLPRPMSDPRLQNIQVRPDLYLKQNFRAPVEEGEQYAVDGHMHAHPQMMYGGMQSGPYGVRPGQYFGGQQYPQMYGMPATGGSPYGTAPNANWGGQQPSSNGAQYGNPPGYANQPYGGGPYYNNRTSSQSGPAGKTEDPNATSQSMPYGGQYAPTYPGMQRSNSSSTPTMIQSAYQTPVQQSNATFGSISGRAGSYGGSGSNVTSPTSNGPAQQQQQQQPYPSAPGQNYAVRSPAQNYAMQGPPAQSPGPSVKSPVQGGASAGGAPTASMTGADGSMPYRTSSYGQSSNAGGEMSGLGISSSPGGYSSQGQQGQSYSNYGS